MIIGSVSVTAAYAQNDKDILQEWKDYLESYKDYMEEYKQWAYDRFSNYEDEIKELESIYENDIKELESINENLSNNILVKDDEIIQVTDQQTRLGVIESGILNNINIQKMQDTIDEQQKLIVDIQNKKNQCEVDIHYYEQLEDSYSHVEHEYETNWHISEIERNTEYYKNKIHDIESEQRVLQFELNQCREN